MNLKLSGKHIAIVGLLTWFAILKYPLIALIIAITHGAIDWWKIANDKKGTLSYFLWDQALHVLVLVLSWLFIIQGYSRLYEVTFSLLSNFDIVMISLGYLLCIGPSSYAIRFATQNMIKQEQEENVRRGGRLIGIFERLIIFTLVLLTQYEAIGFLITGKSILRFADGQKKETEYLLVGTMMSYAIAILTGVLVKIIV